MKPVLLFACLSMMGASLAIAQDCPDAFPKLEMKAYALDGSQAAVSGELLGDGCFIGREYGGELSFSKALPGAIEISVEIPRGHPPAMFDLVATTRGENGKVAVGKIENIHFLIDSQNRSSMVFDVVDLQSKAQDPNSLFYVDFTVKGFGHELYFGTIAVDVHGK